MLTEEGVSQNSITLTAEIRKICRSIFFVVPTGVVIL
jgi:hypothetical protein